MKFVIKCENCKTEFETNREVAKYCSNNCRYAGRRKNSRETRKCKVCETEFEVYKKTKKSMCSDYCRKTWNKRPETINRIRKSMKKTMLEKYGVEHYYQTTEFVEKSKKTKKEKYGNENYVNVKKSKRTKKERYGDENYNNMRKNKNTKKQRHGNENYNNREKFVETMNNMYGVDYAMQSEELKEKSKQTLKERYGVEHIQQVGEINRKSIKTRIEKYGSPNNIEKIKQTNLEKYGVEYGLQNSEIREKIKKTNLERYGTENPSQSKKIRRKVKNSNLKKYGSKNFTQSEHYKKKRFETAYNNLFNSDRLENKVVPLFTLEEYVGCDNEYLFKCLVCDSKFTDHLNNGKVPRCLECYPINYSSSKAEQEIFEFIESLGFDIDKNNKTVLNGKELDIYIPEKKLAIEYNGLYWHSEITGNSGRKYHLDKTLECEKQDIHLIHVFEDEWIHKQDIVKSRLRQILGQSTKKYYARNCKVKEIDAKTKNDFLSKFHIQGEDKSNIKLGAYQGNELVAVMTFSKERLALGNKETVLGCFELSRFCTKHSVIGAASKMLKYFIKKYNPNRIISYADRRWTYSKNNLYTNLGFGLLSEGVPNYWYIVDGSRIHRFGFRKNVLSEKLDKFDSNLTEWQNMQLNGYDRIWDCGSLKYELIV